MLFEVEDSTKHTVLLIFSISSFHPTNINICISFFLDTYIYIKENNLKRIQNK